MQVSICRAKGLPQKFFIRPRAPRNGPLILSDLRVSSESGTGLRRSAPASFKTTSPLHFTTYPESGRHIQAKLPRRQRPTKQSSAKRTETSGAKGPKILASAASCRADDMNVTEAWSRKREERPAALPIVTSARYAESG